MSDEAPNPVDIELVKKNAIAQGIVLQQIAILYDGLNDDEKARLRALDLLKHESGDTTFTLSGDALFAKKITGVHYLGAD